MKTLRVAEIDSASHCPVRVFGVVSFCKRHAALLFAARLVRLGPDSERTRSKCPGPRGAGLRDRFDGDWGLEQPAGRALGQPTRTTGSDGGPDPETGRGRGLRFGSVSEDCRRRRRVGCMELRKLQKGLRFGVTAVDGNTHDLVRTRKTAGGIGPTRTALPHAGPTLSLTAPACSHVGHGAVALAESTRLAAAARPHRSESRALISLPWRG